MMNITEIRAQSVEELNKEIGSLLRAAFNMKVQKAQQQLKNTSQIKKYRRAIARMKTVITEKRMSASC